MLEKLLGKLWRKSRKGGSLFQLRLFFSLLLASLVGSLLFLTFLFISREIPFQGNIGFFLLPVFLITAGIPLLIVIFLRKQNRDMYFRSFSSLQLDGREKRIFFKMLQKQEYREFEEIAVQNVEEQVLTAAEGVAHRLHVLRRFGIVVPEGQQEKILEDERFHSLLGIDKDAFFIIVAVPGIEQFLAGSEESVSIAYRKAIFKSVIKFASRSEFLLPEFRTGFSCMFHGLPYETVAPDLKKIGKWAERWCREADVIAEKAGFPGRALCLIGHGSFTAGLVENSAGSGYLVTGELIATARSFSQDTSRDGVYLHRSLMDGEEDVMNQWFRPGK